MKMFDVVHTPSVQRCIGNPHPVPVTMRRSGSPLFAVHRVAINKHTSTYSCGICRKVQSKFSARELRPSRSYWHNGCIIDVVSLEFNTFGSYLYASPRSVQAYPLSVSCCQERAKGSDGIAPA